MPYQADANQAEIIAALRAAGCSVTIIGGANGNTGVPDLLVGRAEPGVVVDYSRPFGPDRVEERNYLLEVKTAKGKLSDAQERWHAAWRGQVAVVRTVEEALRAVGLR